MIAESSLICSCVSAVRAMRCLVASMRRMYATHNDEHGAPAAQPLREASAEERQYANQLLAKLLDVGYMRRIDATNSRKNV